MGAEDEQAAIPKVDEVELPSFRSPVVYVHARIPPCDTLGHKADTWNVAKPDFTCSMFCCTKGDVFIIRLLTTDDEKFAESFWRPNRPMASVIDAAADSSRYFALRVENPETGAHHFLGMGFADRESAGQFKLTLSEHGKYIQRMRKAQTQVLEPVAGSASIDSPSHSGPAVSTGDAGHPLRDLSLKGSIRVTLPNQCEKRGLMSKLSQKLDGPMLHVGGPQGGLLPPPPGRKQGAPIQRDPTRDSVHSELPRGSCSHQHTDTSSVPSASPVPLGAEASGDVDGGDFGDFCGAG